MHRDMPFTTPWFIAQVQNNGPWDYKQYGRAYEDFGNFNYGATGAAAGFSDDTLLRAAGWAQTRGGNVDPNFGVPTGPLRAYLGIGGVAPYGDDPRDQAMIAAGIKHYRGRQW